MKKKNVLFLFFCWTHFLSAQNAENKAVQYLTKAFKNETASYDSYILGILANRWYNAGFDETILKNHLLKEEKNHPIDALALGLVFLGYAPKTTVCSDFEQSLGNAVSSEEKNVLLNCQNIFTSHINDGGILTTHAVMGLLILQEKAILVQEYFKTAQNKLESYAIFKNAEADFEGFIQSIWILRMIRSNYQLKPEWRTWVFELQNEDGGWGFQKGKESNAHSTILALMVLSEFHNQFPYKKWLP